MTKRKNTKVADEIATNESINVVKNTASNKLIKGTSNMITATIAGVYVGSINANLLRINLNEENVAPYYKGDELTYGKTMIITTGELNNVFRNSICYNGLTGFYNECVEKRSIAVGKAIELRKRNGKTVFVSERLDLLTKVLADVKIEIEFIDVPAFGTYTNSIGNEVENPTTNGEYSHNIILAKIKIKDDVDNVDLDLVEEIQFQFDNWERRNKIINQRMEDIIYNKTKITAKPKTLSDKINDKLNEED